MDQPLALPASEKAAEVATEVVTAATTGAPTDVPKLSKNQLKRKRKFEHRMAIKAQRKAQEKAAKRAKAEAAGRDIDKERQEAEERAKIGGAARKRRQAEWRKAKLPLAQSSFQVGIDCTFESDMTAKEINSLAQQIRYCYSNNRRNPHPCLLSATSLSGETLGHLKNVAGFDEWANWAFTGTDASLEAHYKDRLSDVVYLTSDSTNTLRDLDNSKIYIIGGIVDRNRLKRAAFNRAEKLGVATAKLPIDEFLQKMPSTRVLTCNHVFEILLKYREHERDWKKAFFEVLPRRKDAEFADEVSKAASEENAS